MSQWIQRFLGAVAADATQRVEGSRCLVLAPHPDDEVLGCGGTIVRKIQQGLDVWIAFLTDGRHGIAAPPAEARAVREKESFKAAAALGLAPHRLTFMGFEDGQLRAHMDAARRAVHQLLETHNIDTLFVPYHRDYHADHVAAWEIGMACRGRDLKIYEYLVWYGPWIWKQLGWKARMASARHLVDALSAIKVDVTETLEVKHRALSAYGSQLEALDRCVSVRGGFLANFRTNYEFFFVSP